MCRGSGVRDDCISSGIHTYWGIFQTMYTPTSCDKSNGFLRTLWYLSWPFMPTQWCGVFLFEMMEPDEFKVHCKCYKKLNHWSNRIFPIAYCSWIQACFHSLRYFVTMGWMGQPYVESWWWMPSLMLKRICLPRSQIIECHLHLHRADF